MRHLTPQKPLRERERETDTDGHGQQQVSKRRADGFACAAYSGHHGWGEKHTKHGSFTPRASSSTESHSAILDGGTEGSRSGAGELYEWPNSTSFYGLLSHPTYYFAPRRASCAPLFKSAALRAL